MRAPNPKQPDRCQSIDPLGALQCARRVHDDNQCQFGGIAWRTDAEPRMSDKERADRLEALCDGLAARIVELEADPRRKCRCS